MHNATIQQPPTSMGSVLGEQSRLIGWLLVFGSFVNILVLTGPIFALQVYDRVLGSRSVETLIALTFLMAFLFLVMGVLDHARKRIASRIGERMVSRLENRVFHGLKPGANSPIEDLEIVRNFFASPLFVAMIDVIWLPLFVLALAVLHPMLGWFCLGGGALFVFPGLWHLAVGKPTNQRETDGFQRAEQLAGIAASGPDLTHGVQRRGGLFTLWQTSRRRIQASLLKSQDRRAIMVSAAQTFRMVLQSATIALGAYLVLRGELTSGAIIAATVLLARAIGPLDMISQGTPSIQNLLSAWRRLSMLLRAPHTQPATQTTIKAGVQVDQITVFAPDHRRAALRMLTFDVKPGTVLGVVGPSGSGKSTLARAITGIWPVAGGAVRFGGNSQSAPNIGYLPQNPVLLPGSIRQNISGFCDSDATEACIAAAISTGAHEWILALPDGYETQVGPTCQPFSGGLFQRIALARAVFRNPALLVLDEPMNHLDQDGVDMFNKLILNTKTANHCAIVLGNFFTGTAIFDQILLLESGIQKSLGPPLDRTTSQPRPARPMRSQPTS